MDARAIRLYFRLVLGLLLLKYSSGCQDQALGVEYANIIPDNRITASSRYRWAYRATRGRLNAVYGWAPSRSDQDPYLQIDLGRVFGVCAIGTQGHSRYNEWVTSYKIQFSMDGHHWNTYQENGNDKVFNGNSDRNTEVKRTLAVPTAARYIRFKPLASQGDKVMRVEVYGKQITACEEIPLGMGDSRIPNNKTTASTNSALARRARLGASRSWCASSNDVTPYLQVDLGTSHVICAVATQGNPTAHQWVETYTVMTSSNGVNWTLYLENSKTRIFYGNYDPSSVVRQVFYKSPIARYFRIIPDGHRGERCLRIELYGSPIAPGCRTRSTGIPSRKLIPDHRFTATSYFDNRYYPWYGRLNSNNFGWTTSSADRFANPYLQVDLGSLYYVCAVLTQGMRGYSERAKKYKISYSINNITWANYTENGHVKIFTGNVDNSKIVTNYFTAPTLGKFFRFYPTRYHNYPTVRLDYNGLVSGCATSLGVEGGLVLDSQLSSSSHSDNSHTASAGRLYGGSSWCSSSSNNEFLQVDLGKVKTVTGIATEGDPTRDNWVTQFSIKYSFTGTNWNAFKDGQQNIKTFPGNSGRGTGRVTWFSVPFAGQYIRVSPTAHHGAVCMRVDLYGCEFVFSPSGHSMQVTLNPHKGTTLSLSCAKGYPQPDITWYKNGSKVDGQTTNNIDIRFTSASDVMQSYKCQRSADLAKRAVNCTISYACAATYPLTIPSAAPAQSSYVVHVPLNVIAAPFVTGVPKRRSVTLSLRVAPSEDTGVLTGYTVYYRLEGKRAQFINVGAVSSYELDQLKPYTRYTVKARGTSVVGKGLWSTLKTYTTLMAAPEGKIIISNNRVESSTRMSIWWKKSNDYELNGRFKDYLIEYTPQGGIKDSVSVNTINSKYRRLISLNKFTRYSITISARNTHYKGATSDSISVQTSEDAPECSPTLTLTALNSTSIRATWSPLVDACVNGKLRWYIISYSERDVNAPKVIYIRSSVVTRDIDRLHKYTVYKVKVLGYTIKAGPFSEEVYIRTKPDCPEAIPVLSKVEADSSTSVAVIWKFSDHRKPYGDLKGYQIKYQPKGGVAQYENVSDASAGSFTIDGLGKFTVYDVWISVMNQVCIGPFSPSQEEQTHQDAPDAPPDSLKFTEINSTTFNISWLPVPQHQLNGIIREYELDVKISSNGTSRVRKRRALTASTYKTQAQYAILYGLGSCSIYNLRVRAYTVVSTPGPYTRPITLQTSPPGPPAEFKSKTLSERSIKVTWEPPQGFEGSGGHFTIALKGNKSYWPSFSTDVPEYTAKWSQRSHVFDGLFPGTEYFIDITSTTNCGTSKKTSASDQTQIAAPLPPSVGGISETTNITLWTADQTNGPINWYQIIIYREKSENNNLTDSEAKNLYDYRTAEEKILHYYITAELPATSMGTDRWMIVGKGDTYRGLKKTFDNVQLDESQNYKIYIRAMTYTLNKDLAGEVALAAIIPATPHTVKTVSTPPSAGVIAGAVVAVLIVALVVLVVGLLYKRKQSQTSRDRKSDVRLDELDNREQEVLEEHQQSPAGDVNEGIYDDTWNNRCKPIPITQFSEYVTKIKSNEYAALHEEYKKLENEQQFPWDVARKPENKQKNRYANIVAYDHSRVVLELIDGDNNSDYVNASFLRGYDGKPKAYIASQGPVPPAFEGFWRMIWEQNTSSIIMLTNLVELGKTKCNQYWPEDRDTYGTVSVNCHKTEVFANYAIRTFIISRAGTKETRYVRQFHFTVWPDKGVPRYATAVLGFRRKVHAMTPDNAGPMVVHCSAGVGRTGAYIVIDAMLERAKKLRNIDINNYVVSIRKDRQHMVQTSEQYVFIHLAVLEALSCGNTEIASQNLAIATNKLEIVDQRRQLSGYASEFQASDLRFIIGPGATELISLILQRLNYVTSDQTTDEDTSIGQSSENVDKNRDPDIVALNRCRVILHKNHPSEKDYINATFIDAHRDRNAFILTPAPMENTMADFWRMIADYDIGTIVMLNNLQEGDQSFPRYWPEEGSVTYGDTIVTLITSQSNMDILSSKLRVSRKSKTMDVTHLQHQSWSDKCIPERAQSVLSLHDELQISQQRTGDAPVVVQCSNGVGRSGTFCAIASLIERLKEEHVIDVFQTIKRIRVNRPGAVQDLTQYVFCYQMVKKYLDSFDDYANFGDR